MSKQFPAGWKPDPKLDYLCGSFPVPPSGHTTRAAWAEHLLIDLATGALDLDTALRALTDGQPDG